MGARTREEAFSEAFKIFIVKKVESGELSKWAARRKYNILGHSTVLKWCRKYGGMKKTYLQESKSMFMSQDDYELARLRNENKLLKLELEDARMKSVVMETFVDIAEKELGIPIRKKFGAEQSEK